ncbi:MAG: HAMP domain-containing histidine kinase [Treponema sp.]|nr:HAMP domain-containing histidine kinase [Treponema sp.]
MTIKKRLFRSNIRMVLVTIGGIIAAFITSHFLAAYIIRGRYGFGGRGVDLGVSGSPAVFGIVPLVSIAVFVAFICIINSALAYRMSKKITRPLDALAEGASRIGESNFACRVEYSGDDEFRAVCEAFNKMAAQLEASNERRLKDEASRRELLVGISHDLRTPLTTIGGYLDGLESGVASTAQMREKYFATIKNNAESMRHIIEQLFLFTKLDMNEFAFSPRRVDMLRAISDMTEELAQEYEAKGLLISVADCPEKTHVRADVMRFRRVLVNILENSAKYKEKEAGRVEISARVEGDLAIITLADDGPGVSEEALPHLFDVFYREDPARHTKGSGLGLAICAKIVERSGGSIRGENIPGGGLAIVIRLPLDREEAVG